jgi:c-di-GMP-binding flagellar brake protein YcgR
MTYGCNEPSPEPKPNRVMPHSAPTVAGPADNLPTGQERRASERFACNLETTCQLPKGVWDDPWPAKVRNISKGGVGLVLQRRFEPGTLLVFELESAVQGFAKTFLARVRHATRHAEGGWMHGCAFASELSDEELQAFRVERVRHTAPDCRDWVRFPSKLLVAVQASEEEDHWQAKVVNISPGGIALLTGKAHPVGASLVLELPRADDRGLVRLMVRVVHASARPGDQWLLGCAFAQELNEEELKSIVG